MHRQHGISMIEILVTLVILAFGLLGIAIFQSKASVGSVESYQRAQAVILLDDMSARLQGNPANSAAYVADGIGTGDTQPGDCSTVAVGAARDLCDWSNALKGAAETDHGNAKVGAMIGARGCITQLQAPDPADGKCVPGIYQVAVAWQGLHPTQAPNLDCGKDKFGTETYRRLIAAQVMIPQLACK
ncbi:type IV pilus modification PilV family protein [Pseudoduganella violaceinigra]|uniref:type IV pilus modification PilV family protein n=1 Tax=Pseudoduganella violaceinigra TaxID=246602 RepID=UPI000550B8E5|nr:prepilin-type N-terminal cleavage/methylation domain-containing protein [Pseudoduganella violaceinigra]